MLWACWVRVTFWTSHGKETALHWSTEGQPSNCVCGQLLFKFMSWLAWRWTPQVFLPGESHGQRSLANYSPWGCKKLDTTEATEHACVHFRWPRGAVISSVVCSIYTSRAALGWGQLDQTACAGRGCCPGADPGPSAHTRARGSTSLEGIWPRTQHHSSDVNT